MADLDNKLVTFESLKETVTRLKAYANQFEPRKEVVSKAKLTYSTNYIRAYCDYVATIPATVRVTDDDGSVLLVTGSANGSWRAVRLIKGETDRFHKVYYSNGYVYIQVDNDSMYTVFGGSLVKVFGSATGTEITIEDLSTGGSGESGVADWTTNVTVGGLVSGTNLTGLNSLEILNKITRKYANASATVVWSQVNTVIEQGETFNLDISISGFRAGDYEPTKVALYRDSVLVEELDITDLTSTLSFATINDVSANTSFDVKLTDSNNVTTSISSKSYVFTYPTYIGVVANGSVDETNILTLNKLIRTKTTLTQAFTTTGNQTVVFASIWQLASIINQNNYEVVSNFTLDNITINGINYYVYSLPNVNLDNFQYTFKY